VRYACTLCKHDLESCVVAPDLSRRNRVW